VPTRLLILARSNLYRAAWQALLEKQPRIVVVGAFDEIDRIQAAAQPAQKMAVLVDMPNPQPEYVLRLREASPGSGLLFLLESFDLAEVVSLLQAGATGFILRDAEVGDLARAVIATGRGEIVLPPPLAAKALAALARGQVPREEPAVSLTEREQEVLGLLANGLTNKDIAQTLILSVRTVEAHLRNIYSKLDVSSRTEAALWAVHNGYGNEDPIG
jgi:DNA-binding NarL/FixJ family response regulator